MAWQIRDAMKTLSRVPMMTETKTIIKIITTIITTIIISTTIISIKTKGIGTIKIRIMLQMMII